MSALRRELARQRERILALIAQLPGRLARPFLELLTDLEEKHGAQAFDPPKDD